MVRLNKYIANCGICSRRKADELIETRRVTINGDIVDSLGTMVNENKDIVAVDSKKIGLEKTKIYLMLNKPAGYITTSDEQFSRLCTADLIHEDIRVFPIGRLDMQTEGMLLFTNDGEFSNKLTHPSNKIEKTYLVTTQNDITNDKVTKLKKGVDIGGYVTAPAKVKVLNKNKFEIVITEGKNKQVRKMCDVVELDISNLKRIKVGDLELGDLKTGEYMKLTKTLLNKIVK